MGITGTGRIAVIACMLTLSISASAYALEEARSHEDVAAQAGADISGARELNERGMLLLREGKHDEAVTCFTSALKGNPAAKQYYNNLGVALMRLNRHEEAYPWLKAAVAIDPNYAKALSNLAISCFHLYRFRESYSYYRRARAADTAYSESRFEIGRVIGEVEKLNRENPGNGSLAAILDALKRQKKMP
jgi:Flp pilus assembly protein TadD